MYDIQGTKVLKILATGSRSQSLPQIGEDTMKKTQRGKATKTRKSAAHKSGVRNLEPRKASEVKGGRMWTKGGGASVG